MLTGETPFCCENQGEMLMMHLKEEPPRVTSLAPDVPIWLEELIFDLLEKEPDKRPYDALSVQVKLDEILQKVEQQKSIAEATLKGEATHTGGTTQGDLKDLLGKRRKRRKRIKRRSGRRAWFLSLCFLLFVSGVSGFTYTRMYPSETASWTTIERILASEMTRRTPCRDWKRSCRDSPPVATRQGPRISRSDRNGESRETGALSPENRPRSGERRERLFLEADRIEKFGDRLLALISMKAWLNY